MRILGRLSPRARKVFDWVVGLTLLGIGVIGIFVPILQGWAFILLGLAVLSSHSRIANRINERIKKMGRGMRDRVVRRRKNNGPANDRKTTEPEG